MTPGELLAHTDAIDRQIADVLRRLSRLELNREAQRRERIAACGRELDPMDVDFARLLRGSSSSRNPKLGGNPNDENFIQ
jgi:hypothetical protein